MSWKIYRQYDAAFNPATNDSAATVYMFCDRFNLRLLNDKWAFV